VTFRIESDKNGEDGQEKKMEMLAEVRKEIKKELKEIEDRWDKRLEELSKKVRVGMKYMKSIKKRDVDWEKRWKEIKKRQKEVEDELVEKVMTRLEERRRIEEGSLSEESTERRSRGERESGQSRGDNRIGSTCTIWSEDRLSNKEVENVRKWVIERERKERNDNIILRGITMPEEVAGERRKRQEWMKELLNNKLGVACEVGEIKKSGPVIVAKIVGEEGKKEIMKNQCKLKGEKLFIEKFEDRKVQEKLSRWARGKKSKGIKVKVGKGRKIRDRWIA